MMLIIIIIVFVVIIIINTHYLPDNLPTTSWFKAEFCPLAVKSYKDVEAGPPVWSRSLSMYTLHRNAFHVPPPQFLSKEGVFCNLHM